MTSNLKECPLVDYNDLVQTDQSVFEIDDGLFADVLCFVVFENECLIKVFKKEFSIGFNHARNGKFVENMILFLSQVVRKREVLMNIEELKHILKTRSVPKVLSKSIIK